MYKIRRGNAEAEGGTAEYNGGAEERATRPGRGRISDLSGRRPYLSEPPREMAKWYAKEFAGYLEANAGNDSIFEYPGTKRLVTDDGQHFYDS